MDLLIAPLAIVAVVGLAALAAVLISHRVEGRRFEATLTRGERSSSSTTGGAG